MSRPVFIQRKERPSSFDKENLTKENNDDKNN